MFLGGVASDKIRAMVYLREWILGQGAFEQNDRFTKLQGILLQQLQDHDVYASLGHLSWYSLQQKRGRCCNGRFNRDLGLVYWRRSAPTTSHLSKFRGKFFVHWHLLCFHPLRKRPSFACAWLRSWPNLLFIWAKCFLSTPIPWSTQLLRRLQLRIRWFRRQRSRSLATYSGREPTTTTLEAILYSCSLMLIDYWIGAFRYTSVRCSLVYLNVCGQAEKRPFSEVADPLSPDNFHATIGAVFVLSDLIGGLTPAEFPALKNYLKEMAQLLVHLVEHHDDPLVAYATITLFYNLYNVIYQRNCGEYARAAAVSSFRSARGASGR